MSKPMMVTLPFVLMLLDYWPLNRCQKVFDEPAIGLNLAGKLLWEKVPFIFLVIVTSIITFWAQNEKGTVASVGIIPLLTRCANATISYAAYLGKTFWPFNLAIFYPYELSLPLWKVLISGIILILITLAVLYYIRKLPFLFVGWFWYLGTLIPVIGLVQVGRQAMADRYTYLPSIGIAIILAWGITLLFKREDLRRKILFPAAIAVLAASVVLSWHQCGRWENNFTLFNHALRAINNNYLAYVNRGTAYAELGQYQNAIQDYNDAIHLKPDDSLAHFDRGTTYYKLSQIKQAIEDYNEAIRLNPNYADAYSNRGLAYGRLIQYQQAIDDFNRAIHIRPDYVEDYRNRGVAYLMLSNNEFGCSDAQKACELGNCKLLEMAKGKGFCR
jgi:tetratricopeptide (TPR) repeat protein